MVVRRVCAWQVFPDGISDMFAKNLLKGIQIRRIKAPCIAGTNNSSEKSNL
jgi:hypothetical protein